MKKIYFTYGKKFFFQIMPIILYYISFPFFSLLSIGYLLELVTGNLVLSSSESLVRMIVAVVMPVYLPIFFSSEVNMFPDLKIDDKNIWIRVFTYRWVWKKFSLAEIYGVQLSKKKYRGRVVWLIQVPDDVTIWHKLLGARYGKNDRSYILVTGFLLDLNELVTTLQKNKVPAKYFNSSK